MDTESTWRQTQQQQQQQQQQHQHLMALQQQRRYLHMHQTQQLQHAQQQAILGGLGLSQQQHQRQHQQQQVQQAQQEQQAAQQQQQAGQQPHHHHHQQQQQQQVQQQALILEAASGLPPLPPQARQQLAATLGGQLGGGAVEKVTALEAGACVRRLMQFMHAQRRRPQDNSIEFWRLFVAEYFRPGSKKRWCISSYNNYARQPVGVFPQDLWHCELCGASAGRGFETTVEVLPRLFKIKYDSGVQEELLYIDLPSEHPLGASHVVLQYKNAVLESVFDQLRVVRYGQLRVVFALDLKIQSWEFCTQSHEELIPRRLISNPVVQLANMAVKCQGQNASTLSTMQLQNQLNEFISMSKQLAAKVDTPTVNDLGFTKRYVRCLQISEVVNSMKDLIAFDDEHKLGPIKSLQAFPRMNVQIQSALDTPAQAALHALQQGVSGQTVLAPNAIPGAPLRGSVLAASATAGNRSLLQQQQLTSSLASLSNSSLCHQNSALASLQASIQASAMAGQMGTSANVPQLTNLQLTTGGNNGNVSGHQEATNAMVQQLMQQMLSVQQQQQTAGSGGSGLGPSSPSPFSANGINSASSLLGSFADHITTSFNGADGSDPTAAGIQDLSSSLPPHPSPSASLGPPSASTPASSALQGNSIGSGIGIGPANSNPTCTAIIPGVHSGAGNPGSGGTSNASNKALRNLNSFVDSFIAGGGSSLGALSDGLGTGGTSSRGGAVGAGSVGGLGGALDDLGGGVLGGLSTSPGGVGGVGVGDLPMDDTAESLLGPDAGSLAGLGSLGSGDHPFGNLGNLSDFNWKSP